MRVQAARTDIQKGLEAIEKRGASTTIRKYIENSDTTSKTSAHEHVAAVGRGERPEPVEWVSCLLKGDVESAFYTMTTQEERYDSAQLNFVDAFGEEYADSY